MNRIALAVWVVGCLAGIASGETSRLWGGHGENRTPSGRLPDFSYAGFACGERAIPKVKAAANVRDFGARGDGLTDDTAAFIAAIASVKRGAIEIPPGRYRITKIIEIKKPGVVLRGAGAWGADAKRSVLVFPVPLEKIRPNMGQTTGGRPTSNYSWSGGFIWFKGRQGGKKIGAVSIAAKRGGQEIELPERKSAALKPGDWIEIRVRDDAKKSLLDHLYSGDPGNTEKIKPGSHHASMVTRVLEDHGGRLVLERPLQFDLRPEWQPEIRRFEPTVTTCGVEKLAFEFPVRTYGGHFTELGFNAVAFSGVAHCWAHDLRIVNADSGIFASGRFCTLENICFETAPGCHPDRTGAFGHHGVSLGRTDNLLNRFDFRQRFIHDITVSGSSGNVATSGRGLDMSFDHHKRAPFDNLFSDIDIGEGTRMWKCGGGANLGRNCGARGTFWNIRAKKPQKYPKGFGPASINLVGVETREPSVLEPKGRWFEAIPPAKLQPQNLYKAQLERRLKKRQH